MFKLGAGTFGSTSASGMDNSLPSNSMIGMGAKGVSGGGIMGGTKAAKTPFNSIQAMVSQILRVRKTRVAKCL